MKQDSPVKSRPRRHTVPRPLIVLALIACAFAVAWHFSLPRSVTVALPIRGPAVQAVYATGTVEATVTIRVAPQVAGRLLELKADEGQTAKAGDVLARLDDKD